MKCWAVVVGFVGCLSAAMSGGKCGSGAVSAGISDYASNNMPGFLTGSNNLALKTAYVSVIGGTTSVIAGGQFANGAETAAFGYLFNDLAHDPAWSTDQRLRNAGYLPTYYSNDGILCNGGRDGACGFPGAAGAPNTGVNNANFRAALVTFTDSGATATATAAIWMPPPYDLLLAGASAGLQASNYLLSPPSVKSLGYDVFTMGISGLSSPASKAGKTAVSVGEVILKPYLVQDGN